MPDNKTCSSHPVRRAKYASVTSCNPNLNNLDHHHFYDDGRKEQF